MSIVPGLWSRVGERLRQAAGADTFSFTRIRQKDDRASAVVIPLSPTMSSTWLAGFSAGLVDYELPFDYARAPVVERRRFLHETRVFGEAFDEHPFYVNHFHPNGIAHQARLLVFDDTRFVGIVAICRYRHTAPFSRDDLRRLDAAVAATARDVVAVERALRLPATPGDLVLRADGRVAHASPAGAAWLAVPGFREELQTLAQWARPPEGELPMLGVQAVARVVVLDGDDGVRLLVNVKSWPAPTARVPLTKRQEQVAALLVDGATLKEAAAALGISTETAREHADELYRRLGVSSRVELVQAIRER